MSLRRTVVPGAAGRATRSWSRAAVLASVATAAVSGPAAVSRGQATAPAPAVAPPVNQVSDLTTRYRFIERYAPANQSGKAQAGEIGQYRVANLDVMRVVSDTPQGTPDRKETTVQIIYAERTAAVNSSGVPTALVRRYETFRVTPRTDAKPSAPKPLEGLSVWAQFKPGVLPQLLTLTPNHPMSETEYKISSRRLIFLPELSGVLPALPSRVGDRWTVPRAASQALLGDRPVGKGDPLVGELADVRKVPEGPEMVADIRVTGNAKLPPNGSDTAVNAQVLFRFTPADAAAAPARGVGADAANPRTMVDARGAITDLRLARSSVSAITNAGGGGDGRLRRTFTQELTLRRDLRVAGDPLTVPATPPAATEANSWVTYDDPKGRFHFRHPQDLLPNPVVDPEGDGIVQLQDERAGSPEGRVLMMVLQTKTGDAESDRNDRDPDFQMKDLNEKWARNRREVLRGPAGWLPENVWSPFKMQVYRIEAAEKPSGAASRDVPRIFLDRYLVLFTQNESLVIDAITGQDPPQKFRNQVEEILKTFALGPSSKPGG